MTSRFGREREEYPVSLCPIGQVIARLSQEEIGHLSDFRAGRVAGGRGGGAPCHDKPADRLFQAPDVVEVVYILHQTLHACIVRSANLGPPHPCLTGPANFG